MRPVEAEETSKVREIERAVATRRDLLFAIRAANIEPHAPHVEIMLDLLS
jgi:hypothetical protein